MSNRPIPPALRDLLEKHKLVVPPTGKFRPAGLNTLLRRHKVLGGQRAHLKYELQQAGLLDD